MGGGKKKGKTSGGGTSAGGKKDASGPPAAAAPRPDDVSQRGKKPKGHRQKGSGTVVSSRGEVTVAGVTMKEWQRTPQQLLLEYTQQQKRRKPRYDRIKATAPLKRYRVVLQDPKKPGSDKDLIFVPHEEFESDLEAKHSVALLALSHLQRQLPLERKLPEPYRTMWIEMQDGSARGSNGSHPRPAAKPAAPAPAKPTPPPEPEAPSRADAFCAAWEEDARENEEDDAHDAYDVVMQAPRRPRVTQSNKFVSRNDRDRHVREKKLKRVQRANRREAKEATDPNQPVSVNIATEAREAIAQLVAMDPTEAVDDDNGKWSASAQCSPEDRVAVERGLVAQGFTSLQVHAALDSLESRLPAGFAEEVAECGANAKARSIVWRTAVLDWMCVHLPEDDLPEAFHPRGKQVSLLAAPGAGTPALEQLLQLGFHRADVQWVLSRTDSWIGGWALLLRMLRDRTNMAGFDEPIASEASRDEVDGELEALPAIYGDDCAIKGPETVEEDPSRPWLSVAWTDSNAVDAGTLSGDASRVEREWRIVEVPVGEENLILRAAFPVADDATPYPCLPPLLGLVKTNRDRAGASHSSAGERLSRLSLLIQNAVENWTGEPGLFDLAREVAQIRATSDLVRKTQTSLLLHRAETREKEEDKTASPATPSELPSRLPGAQNTQRKPLSGRAQEALSAKLQSQAEQAASSSEGRTWRHRRGRLSMAEYRSAVLDAVRRHSVVLVAGATGSGKTTQVPQFLLEDAIENGEGGAVRILCTQPRRLAAVSVAQRVAQERQEPLGQSRSNQLAAVGYQIRGERKADRNTRLLFCTTGILLRQLQGGLDDDVTHIIVDEVHERSTDTDFLLVILRRLLRHRPNLRVLLMSATMDAVSLGDLFRPVVHRGKVPHIEVSGFMHPVREVYLEPCARELERHRPGFYLPQSLRPEDSADATPGNVVTSWWKSGWHKNFTAALISWIAETGGFPSSGDNRGDAPVSPGNGGILVFLPGVGEIRSLQTALHRRGSGNLQIVPLHGQMSPAEQNRVFETAPRGKVKVVLATNVAETSVTVEDVTVVIDAGRVKEMQFDPATRLSRLSEQWASQASARQRRGRAGRVRPGVCYRVYPERMWDRLPAQPEPEIRRTALAGLCLQIPCLGEPDIRGFLRDCPDPPSHDQVEEALRELTELSALEPCTDSDALKPTTTTTKGQARGGAKRRGPLESTWQLTALGTHLARLPVDPRLGKCLVFGMLLGCLDPMLTIAAVLASRSPLRAPPPVGVSQPGEAEAAEAEEKRAAAAEARKEFRWDHSDHLLWVRAFLAWRSQATVAAQRSLCHRFFLSHDGMRTIAQLRGDFAKALCEAGFIDSPTVAEARRSRNLAAVSAGDEDEEDDYDDDEDTAGIDVSSATRSITETTNTPQFGPNANALDSTVIRAALCAGLYPRLIHVVFPPRKFHHTIDGAAPTDFKAHEPRYYVRAEDTAEGSSSHGDGSGPKRIVFRGVAQERVFLHPSSVHFDVGEYKSPWLVYHEKVQTSKVFVRDASEVPPLALLLFGGKVRVKHAEGELCVGEDDWVRFKSPARVGVLVRELRERLQRLLAAKVADPSVALEKSAVAHAMLKLLRGGIW